MFLLRSIVAPWMKAYGSDFACISTSWALQALSLPTPYSPLIQGKATTTTVNWLNPINLPLKILYSCLFIQEVSSNPITT